MPINAPFITSPFITAMLVPTGIGASVGGFAGDATPVMNLLSSCCDILITHPNVANAALFQKLPDNALYVEGYALDRFFKGEWSLAPVRANRVGVLMDSGIPAELKMFHHNVLRSLQAVYGIDIVAIEETAAPLQITYGIFESENVTKETNCSSGALQNPHVLLETAEKLKKRGAEAIALCVYFAENQTNQVDEQAYRNGVGVDPVGGVEAILSHTVVSALKLPCANSPVFPYEGASAQASPAFYELLNPKVAAEYLAPTFLPCVVQGLSKAPRILEKNQRRDAQAVSVEQLNALVVPADALGGAAVLACLARKIPVIAVSQNKTVCDITPAHFLKSQAERSDGRLYEVASYLEAAGLLQALRQGITPASLGRAHLVPDTVFAAIGI
ncbi:MAG: DUF3326 domain-containing protein [Vampirovibrionales bacterium]|nr:DUF3326 domain-containing protein [Vampirovibrionales bacterium]